MLLVPRRVRKLQEQGDSPAEVENRTFLEFRPLAAWVLLGEPGAGKSKALEYEAKATGGVFLSIAEFLIDDSTDEWQDKALFLDGLDEIRGGGGDESILLRTRLRLRKMGNPPFRIACRAADWFGSTDREAIAGASFDGRVAVLQLEPLSDEDTLDILRQNHAVADPAGFVEKARQQGVADLLKNPQTLGLLAQAIRGEQWPETREQTFELACEKLAEETGKSRRDKLRSQALAPEKLLDAAGQLFAVLLLADKTGIALDATTADERFPALECIAPPDLAMAQGVVRRALFIPSTSGEERLVPGHRSIAEFLAARWLAQRVDCDGLPLGRVLNLLLASDGRTVAGLRGLYGWLALHCRAARTHLIEADPLTVVVYGDVKPMSRDDKRNILAGLRREAERYTDFRWEISTPGPLGALADSQLQDDFIAALDSPERDAAAQAFAHCVLDILVEGKPLPELATSVRSVIGDDTRWAAVRASALQAWLRLGVLATDAVALLNAIADGSITDTDDQLSGLLLRKLYPESIESDVLLHYLHVPKDEYRTGSFALFWGYELPEIAPESHLPVLLDQLAARTDMASSAAQDFRLNRMLGALLVRGVVSCGDEICDERLFSWLGIGADKHGDSRREKEHDQAIAKWLESHPERYKGLLAICFKQCDGDDCARACVYSHEHRFHRAAVPEDIGLWHLDQASQTANDTLAEEHLFEAVSTLIYQRGSVGLTLEKLEAWGEANPKREPSLKALLTWEIPQWRLDTASRTQIFTQQQTDRQRERWIRLSENMDDIRSGTANAAGMHVLAGVWKKHYSDTHGNTPLERFESYCENASEVLAAAETGFRRCPQRSDLPSAIDIIDLSIQKKEHFIRTPCLIGMDLRWLDGIEAIDSLPDDTLQRMLAFRLTYGAESTPDWFTYLVETRPALVARILIDYANATLTAKQDIVDSIYPLAHDLRYRAVAHLAAPALLERFPLRARSGQLRHLKSLLKSALAYSLEQLPSLIEKKVSAKSVDASQKVYWLASAMLLDPVKYETELWRYIGNSQSRANTLSGFLSDSFRELGNDYPLSARSIGKLIELLAPHAELEWSSGGGWVNEAMRRGDHIRSLITRLGNLATNDAAQEIERLLTLPTLGKLKFTLENSRYQLRLKQRESAFRFPSLAKVVQILANREPTGVADLMALTLDHFDDFALEVRRDNSDPFRHFWNEAAINAPKPENSCRDYLLDKFRTRLAPFGIDCQPEGDYFNDKRADIRLSFGNEFQLPIEIKRDSNDSLWTALRTQLIAQYAIAGHGLYLVLWFGGERLKAARDGGKKPCSPEELQARLEAQLDPEERKRIFVRVLDISWPSKR